VGAQSNYAAYGLAALQNSAGEVSVGALGSERKITNVAAGSATTDAVNVSQLQAVASNLAGVQGNALLWDATANGGNGAFSASHGAVAANKITNVANGDVSAGSTDAVNGGQLYALVGNTSTTYTNSNGTGIKYIRTNDNGLATDDAHAAAQGRRRSATTRKPTASIRWRSAIPRRQRRITRLRLAMWRWFR